MISNILATIALTLIGVGVLIATIIIGLMGLFLIGLIITSKVFIFILPAFVIVYSGYYIGQFIKRYFSDKRNTQ